jgi:hypothetical protein
MPSCPSRDGYLLENAVLLFYELPVRVCPGLITPWVRHKISYMLFAKFFSYFILLFEFRGAVVSLGIGIGGSGSDQLLVEFKNVER